jgi:malate/lactate dehydrogenase
VASTALDGAYEIYDAALGVPVRLGPHGVEQGLEWEPGELAALRYASR